MFICGKNMIWLSRTSLYQVSANGPFCQVCVQKKKKKKE